MKKNEYYIVHNSILPDYFEQVIKVRELINDKGYNISDACKMENISRSTYYKYKDCIFRPQKTIGCKAMFSIKTEDEKGILSNILQVIYGCDGNIISINQSSPIDKSAYISLSIDASELNISLEELKNKISKLNHIKAVDIMGVE